MANDPLLPELTHLSLLSTDAPLPRPVSQPDFDNGGGGKGGTGDLVVDPQHIEAGANQLRALYADVEHCKSLLYAIQPVSPGNFSEGKALADKVNHTGAQGGTSVVDLAVEECLTLQNTINNTGKALTDTSNNFEDTENKNTQASRSSTPGTPATSKDA